MILTCIRGGGIERGFCFSHTFCLFLGLCSTAREVSWSSDACSGGVSGSADQKLAVFSLDWDQMEVQEQPPIPLKKPGVAALALRQDGRIFAAAGWDGRVRLHRGDTRKLLAVLQYHKSGVQDVCFDERSKRLASASKDGSIAMWSVYTDA